LTDIQLIDQNITILCLNKDIMHKDKINILLAQFNARVGAIQENYRRILNIIDTHQEQVDLIVFPELAICGYPPEDLLLFPDFIQEIEDAMDALVNHPSKTKILIGYPRREQNHLFNSVALIENNTLRFYDKRQLPNYSVFSEARYFSIGTSPYLTFSIKNHSFGVLICEDIWNQNEIKAIQKQGIDTLISINASPYHQDKLAQRLEILKHVTQQPINHIYVNCVGGQDEILFDGQSLALNQLGEIQAKGNAFKNELIAITIDNQKMTGPIAKPLSKLKEVYQALQFGLKEFIQKNHIKKVVLGLSGGIDSALTLAIAVDALGFENVHAILMPSQHTAQMSIDDAVSQAKILNVSYEIIPIEPYYQQFANTQCEKLLPLTAQNLQARIRGLLLMTYSNQHQALLLSTSNKSETAVGYCTLYGDMCGGYAVLKDVYKTQIYELANFVNCDTVIIPNRVITRAPTAELAPNQTDQDDLPGYDILDKLLKDIIEHKLEEKELIKKYPRDMVEKIVKKIKQSEFKRFQAAPGTKISATAFGKDWRIPICNDWKL